MLSCLLFALRFQFFSFGLSVARLPYSDQLLSMKMAITSCFSALFARKKSKEKKRSKIAYKCGDLRVNPEEQVHQHVQNLTVGITSDEPNHTDQLAHSSVEVANIREPMLMIAQGKSPVENAQTKTCGTKNLKFEQTELVTEAVYEGGDEDKDNLSLRKDFSDFDLQALEADKHELNSGSVNEELNIDGSDSRLLKEDTASEMITYTGHVSDLGLDRTDNLWSQNHWVALYSESSTVDRVDAWVQSVGDGSSHPIDSYQDDEPAEEATSSTNILEVEKISRKKQTQTGRPTVKDIMEGSYIFQPPCSFPHTAHISGMGLKTIPVISAFSNLRSVNLSGNMIAHISSGSLPKNLLTLDLSRNKITTIEGLKELMRLRVLNLSYNRISRIGHGFPNGTLIKELYLAGNKISYVEGLHRLLKLKVLDLSFNSITTARALSQLVANDSSLLALNLVGNPILSNFSEAALRKKICSILPKISYLNKKPIDPRKGQEVALHSISKAALESNNRFSQKQLTRRVIKTTSSSVKSQGREKNTYRGASRNLGERSRMNRSRGKHQRSIT
ncbi:hypothetical protein ZIOFF_064364 [Zingiber officinale]|uniref:Leucine-rich repeat family protein n=2 Tax=Zingiber officinale TaxID=94328 RepID=A0A8J5EWC3_ZINOF|nr:hypothetical protein ZIOFF_064364 [Zingiber officinale]